MNKLVSIIIINWNGLSHLKKCLPSLSLQKYKHVEVIIVDNASTDGSVEYIEKNFPKIKVVVNDRNYGFAHGNNIGYEHVKGDYVLFLNNDTKVKSDFIIELLNVVDKDKRIAGAQSKILLMDEPTKYDSIGAFLTSTGFLYHYGVAKEDRPQYDHQINLYSAKGACMLFRKSVLEKIKVHGEIMDKSYFAYFEETDMCHRVWLAGFRIVYAPKSIIFHKVGATSNKFESSFVQYHSFKNRINSYLKNLDGGNVFRILPIHLILCQAFALILLSRFKLSVFLSIQKAIGWNVVNLGETLKKRKAIQSAIRTVSDSQIFPYILKDVGARYYLNLFSALRNYRDPEILTK